MDLLKMIVNYILKIITLTFILIISYLNRHRSSSRARKAVIEGNSGGSVMSGTESNSTTPTTVSSTVSSNQLVSTTGEDELASTATSATGNFTYIFNFSNKQLIFNSK